MVPIRLSLAISAVIPHWSNSSSELTLFAMTVGAYTASAGTKQLMTMLPR
jgi:hypothetical protein